MITVNHIKQIGYTTSVECNDGELQLLIVATGGQHGGLVHSVIMVGLDADFKTIIPQTDLPYEEAAENIKTKLAEWMKADCSWRDEGGQYADVALARIVRYLDRKVTSMG